MDDESSGLLSESSKLNSSKAKLNEEEKASYINDTFVWDKPEVVKINKKRLKENVIPIILRYKE